MSKKLWTGPGRWIIAAIAVVLLVGGTAAITAAVVADDDDGDDNGTNQVSAEGDRDDANDNDADDGNGPSGEPEVSLTDAVATASDEVSRGVMTSVELEGTDQKPLWRVDFITSDGTEHEVSVDAADGTVTDHFKDADNDTGDWKEAKSADDKAKVSLEEAAKTALDEAGKGTVTSIELDEEGSDPQWDVDVATGKNKSTEVSIDAVTGKVINTQNDTDDNDGDDDRDND